LCAQDLRRNSNPAAQGSALVVLTEERREHSGTHPKEGQRPMPSASLLTTAGTSGCRRHRDFDSLVWVRPTRNLADVIELYYLLADGPRSVAGLRTLGHPQLPVPTAWAAQRTMVIALAHRVDAVLMVGHGGLRRSFDTHQVKFEGARDPHFERAVRYVDWATRGEGLPETTWTSPQVASAMWRAAILGCYHVRTKDASLALQVSGKHHAQLLTTCAATLGFEVSALCGRREQGVRLQVPDTSVGHVLEALSTRFEGTANDARLGGVELDPRSAARVSV
jgi:hypothetical protein